MQDISLHVLDLIQNAVTAKASLIKIAIEDDPHTGRLSVSIEDNGSGMSEEQAATAVDPFYTTRKTRRVGLGIPMFKAAAELSGGCFELRTDEGRGTQVKAVFNQRNIDCLPLGKTGDTLISAILCNPDIDFIYVHSYGDSIFELDTRLIRCELGEVPINHPDVLNWIADYISQGLDEIYGGV
jgi:anti-sigma regulatory factor (Ser/Thr protein kinase)